MSKLNIRLDKTLKTVNGRGVSGGVILVEGRAADVAALYLEAYENPSKRVPSAAPNTDAKYFNRDEQGFYGPLDRALALFKNTEPCPPTSKRFPVNKLAGNKAPETTRRQRITSDMDGDWEYDRRNLDTPFVQYKRMEQAKVIWIDVSFSFNCNVSSNEIREYGEYVFALIAAVERRGFQCGVRLNIGAVNISVDWNVGLLCKLIVKKPGEYADKRFFRFFTNEFFRRAIFYLDHVACHAVNVKISSSLGQAANISEAKATKGNIQITPGSVPQPGFFEGATALIDTALAAA